jgi:hypothetical protein
MGCDHFDKHTYDNLEDAQKRLEYLNSLPAEKLADEGVTFVPNWFRIQQEISPNPLRRFLNRCGSKRMYKVFGFWI